VPRQIREGREDEEKSDAKKQMRERSKHTSPFKKREKKS